ncbi:MAG: methionyl-tRNA formyltransferase, partial [Candidatus Dormibacteraeota bacterium]|nr:methionyl-tRNA formyltransferase [Candidatus Dormibacteraeota bacterium]
MFFGTASFAVPALRALTAAGHQVELVVTQPDRPAHRLQMTAPAVKLAAQELGLRLFQPERLRAEQAVSRIAAAMPDLLVVAAYGQIVPASVLSVPTSCSLNVHASLLPRWRGAAPIAYAIREG